MTIRKTKKAERAIVYCERCGKSMAPGRARRKKFCTNACKQAAYRDRMILLRSTERNEEVLERVTG